MANATSDIGRGTPHLPGIPVEHHQPYGRTVSILHIEHPITDFETWAAPFDRCVCQDRQPDVGEGGDARVDA